MPNFPGEFPGFPQIPTDCKESGILCEQITTSAPTHVCEIKKFASSEVAYLGKGRSEIEARKNVMASCMLVESSPSCYSNSDQIVCH
jgi:hypothetical protein